MPYHYESTLQDAVIAAVKKKYGDGVWMYKANDQNQVGIPDLIICFFGHFVAIELKLEKRARPARRVTDKHLFQDDLMAGATPKQRYNIKMINGACGSAFVGYQVGTIMARLDKLYQSLKMIQ